MMHYIVLDIEATENKEIIEIGAVKVNEKLEVVDKYQSFVNPTMNNKLSYFIKKLTKIQQADINNARNFIQVYDEFLNWMGEDVIIVTWGNEDKRFMTHDLELHNIVNQIENKFKNIQVGISRMLLSENDLGLKSALEKLDIYQEGNAHRAFDDALNTAKIFIKTFNVIKNIDSSYKLSHFRYSNYLDKLSIFELQNKMTMIVNLLEKEVKAIDRNDSILFHMCLQRYEIVKSTLKHKIKIASLESEGLTIAQVNRFIKNANILHRIKDNLVVRYNLDAIEFHKQKKVEINSFKKESKRYKKVEFLKLKKPVFINQNRKMIETINELNSSLFTREKFKKEIAEVYIYTNKILNELDANKIQSEVS